MKIGFIGFGEVSKRLSNLLSGNILITSKENRSKKTIENINSSNICILETFEEVAKNSDILISATSPKQSLENAKRYGKLTNGIYLDLNNISPKTAIRNSKNTRNFVDGSIIGSINSNFTLYLSGKDANKLNFLNEYFPVRIISNNVGDASKLKILRSIYTKSLSATLIETLTIAEKLNLKDELLDTIAISEGEDFKEKAISRVKNTKNNAERKKEELQEIIEYFPDDDLEIVKASIKKLSNI